jgi:hypothetical protein
MIAQSAVTACWLGHDALRKRAFLEFSLRLSRACLGKKMTFIYKWRKEPVFLPSLTCVVWLVRVELARVLCVADFFASNNVFRANYSLVNSDADSLSAADLVLAEEAVVAALLGKRHFF